MPIDLLGPGAFGAARAAASRPALTPSNTGSDTWAQDCTTPTAADGTEDRAAHMNALLGQLRGAIRAGAVTEDNTDDSMLARAMRSQRPNWIGTVGGSANALTATLSPAPANWSDLVGTPFRLITASANTTTTPTLNLNALGAKTLVFADGGALVANAWGAGAVLEVIYDGTNVRVLSGASRPLNAPDRFSSSTVGTANFTPTVTGWHEIELVGGGGGGGGGVGTGGGGGGGGGGRVVDYAFLQAGTAYSYTIGGGGGAGGAGFNGNAGSNTTFAAPGGTLTASGGGLGGGANTGVGGTGGNAGSGSGGSAKGRVDTAQTGFQGSPQISQGGQGGSSPGGGYGGQASFGGGNTGSAPGGGGSGGTGGNAGGNGAAGRITIRW